MIRSRFEEEGSLSFPYAPENEISRRLAAATAKSTGMDALLYVLHEKITEQTGRPDSRVFVLSAGTGAGKSTTMIRGLYKNLVAYRSGKKIVICTQPRVNLAMNQPKSLAFMYKDIHEGANVGYITGAGGKVIPTEVKSIIYCTTRILDQIMQSMEPAMFGMKYPFVVIDEAHEQSTEMLMTLRTVQQYVSLNFRETWCPTFIISSATINPKEYLDYFGADAISPFNAGYIAAASPFPVEERYLTKETISAAEGNMCTLAVDRATELVTHIMDENKTNHTDILAFWASSREITRFLDALTTKLKATVGKKIRSIHRASSLSVELLDEEAPTTSPPTTSPPTTSPPTTSPPTTSPPTTSPPTTSPPTTSPPTTTTSTPLSGGKSFGQHLRRVWTHHEAAADEEEDDGRWRILLLTYTRLEVLNRAESYELTYRPQRPHEIRIIGATNAIEAGATLGHLLAVIDSGRILTRLTFPLQEKESMVSLPVATVSRIQRRGRVGRTGPGLYIGLYDEETKKAMHTAALPSTLVGSSVPSAVYEIITNKTLRRYQALVGTPGVIGKLLSLKKLGAHLPITDIVGQIQLLYPISVDTCLKTMSRLVDIGLIEWDGSLTLLGMQVSMYRGRSVGEVLLRAFLSNEAVHPFDIELLWKIVYSSLARAELASVVEWRSTMSRYYPYGSFTPKDSPPHVEEVVALVPEVMRVFEAFSSESYDETSVYKFTHPRWGHLNFGEVRETVYAALEAFNTNHEVGAFYVPLFIEKGVPEKEKEITAMIKAIKGVLSALIGRPQPTSHRRY